MGGFLSIGKSRAKIYAQTDTGVTFADVAGRTKWIATRKGFIF